MPLLVGLRINPWLGACYECLRSAGKRPKIAMMAAMHKPITAIYNVAAHHRPFVPRVTQGGSGAAHQVREPRFRPNSPLKLNESPTRQSAREGSRSPGIAEQEPDLGIDQTACSA